MPRMPKYHDVQDVTISEDTICLTVDGKAYSAKLSEHSKKLTEADEPARKNFVISPSGYGIHWPQIDEDLAIDALIGLRHQHKRSRSPAAK